MRPSNNTQPLQVCFEAPLPFSLPFQNRFQERKMRREERTKGGGGTTDTCSLCPSVIEPEALKFSSATLRSTAWKMSDDKKMAWRTAKMENNEGKKTMKGRKPQHAPWFGSRSNSLPLKQKETSFQGSIGMAKYLRREKANRKLI